MTLRDAAAQLGCRVKTVRNLLHRYPSRFSREYTPKPVMRSLNETDLETLRTLLLEWRQAMRDQAVKH
jgi:hypothetical protein